MNAEITIVWLRNDLRLEDNPALYHANEYAKKSTVTDDEVELLYEERKESLIEPEERFLYQILIDSQKEANELAGKIKPRALSGDSSSY